MANYIVRSAASGVEYVCDLNHPDRREGEQKILDERIRTGALVVIGPADEAQDPERF